MKTRALLPNVLGTTHDIPSREDCLKCHASASRDVVLGFSAIQLGEANLPLTLDDLAAASEMSQPVSLSSAAVPGTTVQPECDQLLIGVGLLDDLPRGFRRTHDNGTYIA